MNENALGSRTCGLVFFFPLGIFMCERGSVLLHGGLLYSCFENATEKKKVEFASLKSLPIRNTSNNIPPGIEHSIHPR